MYPIAGLKRFPVLSGPPIPWIASTPPPSPAPTLPPGTQPCTAAELTVHLPGMVGATMGQVAGELRFRNIGTRACTLHGYPALQLLGTSGTLIPAPESHGRPMFSPLQPKPAT